MLRFFLNFLRCLLNFLDYVGFDVGGSFSGFSLDDVGVKVFSCLKKRRQCSILKMRKAAFDFGEAIFCGTPGAFTITKSLSQLYQKRLHAFVVRFTESSRIIRIKHASDFC
ncbi:HMG box-containing 1 isoform X3, putative [Babesia ovata]|uniref:HMG box-containing 1 isoform X3, putative n=1 Tax=Babesia ovata TaxID=189622 RepID=A0A2H6KAH8_9APIC|nr:HMG box-containing 1 isoform X3, putative [Babesia ovata]GBE60007.1 HMG box-containing 1 isoform X3, putative [Babesia ovata]